MLTAKGIGGGSAKVTNGILQEMYAAEGEIPADTFVELTSIAGSIDKLGLEVVKMYDSDIEPEYTKKIQLKDNLFFYLLPKVDGFVKPAVGKVNSDHTLSVTNFDTIVQNSSSGSATEYLLGLSAISEDKIIVLTNPWSSKNVYYQVLQVSESQVSILTPVTLLTAFSQIENSVNNHMEVLIKISPTKLLFCFDSQVSNTWHLYRTLLNFDPATNQISSSDLIKLGQYSSYPNRNSGFSLSNSKVLFQCYLTSDSQVLLHTFIFDLSGSALVKSFESTDFDTLYKANDTCIFSFRKNEKAVKLYEITNTITLKTESQVISREELNFNTYSDCDDFKQILALNNNILLVLFMKQQAKKSYDSNNNIITQYANIQYAAKLFKINEDFSLTNLLTEPGYLELLSGITSSEISQPYEVSVYRVMFVLQRAINYSSGYHTVLCKYAQERLVLSASVSKIQGLTKNLCTPDQKGQVWLLNTQEGETSC